MSHPPHICQVAFSALDAFALRKWYQQVFNFLFSGQTLFFPPGTTNVQGIDGAFERCGWLIDGQEYFQLEFFQFLRPRSTPRPANRTTADIGYNRLGIYCEDFDAALERAVQLGGTLIGQVIGRYPERLAHLQDPEGNRLQIFEQDPVEGQALLRPEMKTAVRSMMLSVPNLDAATQYFTNAFGFQTVDKSQNHHHAEPNCKTRLLRGSNFLLELTEFPDAQPWPGNYCISDQGFMNIALGYQGSDDFDTAFSTACDAGLKANGVPTDIAVFKVMYVNTPDGFSVEMLAARKAFWKLSGFKPTSSYLSNTVWIDAPPESVWEEVSDHRNLGRWCLFNGEVIKDGETELNGLGAVRQLTALGLRIEEAITHWQAGHHYSYRLIKGAPLKNHRGDILLTGEQGGTRLRWTIRFDVAIPGTGTITALLLKFIFARALQQLKKQLEQ